MYYGLGATVITQEGAEAALRTPALPPALPPTPPATDIPPVVIVGAAVGVTVVVGLLIYAVTR